MVIGSFELLLAAGIIAFAIVVHGLITRF